MTKKEEYIDSISFQDMERGVEVGIIPLWVLRRARIIDSVRNYQRAGKTRMNAIAFTAVDFNVTERTVQNAIQ